MLVPTFLVGSTVKKCRQKIFDTTHSLGCGTTFCGLSPTITTFFKITGQTIDLKTKLYYAKFHYSRKIYNFAQENFHVGSIVWLEIAKIHLKKLSQNAENCH